MGSIKRPINEVMAIEILVAVFVLIALCCLSSCKCPQIAESVNIRDSIRYHDTTIVVHDTAKYKTEAFVDSLMKIILSQKNTVISTSTKNGVTTTLRTENGKIICESTIDSLNHLIDSLQDVTHYVDRTKILWKEKELKWWQKALMGFGSSSLIFILGGLFWKLKK